MDSVTGQTVMDPKGYLTDLNALQALGGEPTDSDNTTHTI